MPIFYANFLNPTEPNLRLKMRVVLANAAGLDEAGIDGGGLFREFLSELLKTSFDPNRGFFRLTNDQQLYPNPNVGQVIENYLPHYFFIGRMLGKVTIAYCFVYSKKLHRNGCSATTQSEL